MTNIDILKSCPLFENLSETDLSGILSCLGAKEVFFNKKKTIISEGDAAKHIGIVLSGSAQIVQQDYYGNRRILGNIGPSQLFGEAFACAEIPHMPISVIANEPSKILFIDCKRILYTCSNSCNMHHQLIFNLMKVLSSKVIMFHQKIEITSRPSTREKLLTYLLLQAKEKDSSSFTIPFNRQELADYLQVDRSGLSAEISKLRKEGILESDHSFFKLLKDHRS